MVGRDDVTRFTTDQKRVVALVQRELRLTWAKLDLSHPEETRDALLELLPALTHKYGDIAGTAAMEWYMGLRGQVAGLPAYVPLMSDGVPFEAIQDSTRWAAGHLWSDSPEVTFDLMERSLARWVRYAGRDTVRKNIARDPAKPRWARVPRGVKTCAWCTMLASRGWAYSSRVAVENGNHEHCDCEVVPNFAKDVKSAVISGYDPDHYKQLYKQARESLPGGGKVATAEEIVQAMRRTSPHHFTDGIYPEAQRKNRHDDSLKPAAYQRTREELAKRLPAHAPFRYKLPPSTVPRAPKDWPEDLPQLRDKEWAHILYGEWKEKEQRFKGGHLFGHGWAGGRTEFPESWGIKEVQAAAEHILRNGNVQNHGDYLLYLGEFQGVALQAYVSNGRSPAKLLSMYPGA